MTKYNAADSSEGCKDALYGLKTRPAPSEQWGIITEAMNGNQPELGAIWHLISCNWLGNFRNFCLEPREHEDPGPVDNSDIAELGSQGDWSFGLVPLRPGLYPEDDYVAIPYAVWSLLEEWYGISPRCPKPITRPIILADGERQIEYEPPIIRIQLLDGSIRRVCVSRATKCSLLKSWIGRQEGDPFALGEENGTGAQKEIGIHISTDCGDSELTELLDDCNIAEYPTLLSGMSTLIVKPKFSSQEAAVKPWRAITLSESSGVVGLRNLGNTCFMNSALQCLSNCKALTMYFLEGHHLDELNKENPIGSGGAMAISYGDLLRQLWDRSNPETASAYQSPIDPGRFKSTLARLEPRFMGYHQHDSQELLSCLLDRLHEDVNRVKIKSYIELNDSDGRPDEIVAQEAWDNHRMRNDSIIVDCFHGQFKSTVLCPACGYKSITFDPFEFLSLPLPKPAKVYVEVTIAVGISFTKARVEIVKRRDLTISHLIAQAISQGQAPGTVDDFVAVEIFNNEVYRVYRPSFLLEEVNFVSDEIALYSVAGHQRSLWLSFKQESFPGYSSTLGDPILIDAKDIKDDKQAVRDYIMRTFGLLAEIESELDTIFFIEPDYSLQASDPLTSGVVVRVSKQRFHEILGKNLEDLLADTIPRLNTQPPRLSHTSSMTEDSSITLNDCLAAFCSEEKLSDDELWYCKKCKTHQAAFKKMDLWRLPKILIIHLKRFSYSRMWGEKLGAPVNFPIRDFVLPSCHRPYELFAVSNHFGSLGGGHYTAFAKNFHNQRWYSFDDSCVSEGDSGTLQATSFRQSAYLLFYAQVDGLM